MSNFSRLASASDPRFKHPSWTWPYSRALGFPPGSCLGAEANLGEYVQGQERKVGGGTDRCRAGTAQPPCVPSECSLPFSTSLQRKQRGHWRSCKRDLARCCYSGSAPESIQRAQWEEKGGRRAPHLQTVQVREREGTPTQSCIAVPSARLAATRKQPKVMGLGN